MRREIPEQWAVIAGYTRYEASSHGRVRNRKTGKVLKPYRTPRKDGTFDPHPKLDIRSDEQKLNTPKGKRHTRTQPLVSQLVCRAFYGLPDFPNAQAEHQDGDAENNHLSNLSWQTQSVNELRKVFQGKRQFKEEDIRFIRRSKWTARQLAVWFGCSLSTIYNIRAGRTYRQVTADVLTDSLPHIRSQTTGRYRRRGMTELPQEPTL